MQKDGTQLLAGHTVVALLKACVKAKDIEKGLLIHSYIVTTASLERDLFVGSTLVDMYAKCSSVVEAQKVFDKLPTKSVVTWNALMRAYATNGHSEVVLKLLEQMQKEDIAPDAFTFVCILKACCSMKAIDKALEVQDELRKQGLLETDAFVNSALVDLYGTCGFLCEAEEVFSTLIVRNVVVWNTLIGTYASQGRTKEIHNCFERMQIEGISPDAVTFACTVRACGSTKNLKKGKMIHVMIEKSSWERDVVLGTALVGTYMKCGWLDLAQQAFDKLSLRDVLAWTALITGYNDHGCDEKVLICFKTMQEEAVPPNIFIFTHVLKACIGLCAMDKGQEVHAEIERIGLLERDLFIRSALVDLYAKCDTIFKAREVFDSLSTRDVVIWNALITGYVEHEHGEEALECFERMKDEAVFPTNVSFICGLKACGCIRATHKVEELHLEVKETGIRDTVFDTTLVDTYAKCGLLSHAQQVFDKLPAHNLVAWNTLIAGYAEHDGHKDVVLRCCEQMQLEGIAPDAFTLVPILKMSGGMGDMGRGGQIHAEISRQGFLERDVVIGNALIDMYAKHGSLVDAQHVFDKLPSRDVVSWNAMIAGYAEKGCGEQALRHFESMQLQGVSPNLISYIGSLNACAGIGSIAKGQQIHAEVIMKGILEEDLVGNALIDMYAKCGSLVSAEDAFHKLKVLDMVSCNSLIAGYAKQGEPASIFHILKLMSENELDPDSITFLAILSVCSSLGLYGESRMYYEAMRSQYGLVPTHKHHNCIVDILGRVGQLDMAATMIMKVPACPNLAVRRSMLNACKYWGNIDLGKKAFKDAVHLDEAHASAYILMSQLAAGFGEVEADKVPELTLCPRSYGVL